MSTGKLSYGETAGREVSARAGGDFASTAALTALPAALRVNGMLCVVSNQPWIFNATSAAGASATCLVPDAGTGRWIAASGTTTIEDSTAPVASGIGAVGNAATVSASNHVHPHTAVNWVYDGDAAVGTTLAAKAIAGADTARTVSAVNIKPTGAVTANNTNYGTIIVGHRDGAGSGGSVLATLVTNVAGGDWVAFVTKSMGAITSSAVPAGSVFYCSIAKAAGGIQLPSFVVEIIFA